MNCHYCLIQYIDDPICNESKNIGIIVHNSQDASLRLIGVDCNHIDTSSFENISERTKGNGWIYREWISWFEDLIVYEGKTLEGLQTLSQELDGGNFVIKAGGVIEADPNESLDEVADTLFASLVSLWAKPDKPPAKRRKTFLTQVEELLSNLYLSFRGGINKNVELALPPVEGKKRFVKVNYLIEYEPKTVFLLIPPNGSPEKIIQQISSAMTTFMQLQRPGYVDRNRCIVLTDRHGHQKSPTYWPLLAHYAHIVSISDPNALRKITSIIETGDMPQD